MATKRENDKLDRVLEMAIRQEEQMNNLADDFQEHKKEVNVRLRKIDHAIRGNGEPGINERVRNLEDETGLSDKGFVRKLVRHWKPATVSTGTGAAGAGGVVGLWMWLGGGS